MSLFGVTHADTCTHAPLCNVWESSGQDKIRIDAGWEIKQAVQDRSE